MSKGDRTSITVVIEVEQGGPLAQSSRAVTVAVARALFGKSLGGRMVWAKGTTSRCETMYVVRKISGHGVEVDAPTAAGDAPVREVPDATS